MTEQRLFHYTYGLDRLCQIVADREIRCAGFGVESGERAAAWFSFEPWREPSSLKLLSDSKGRVRSATWEEALTIGMFRIEVDPSAAPTTWADFRKASGISSRMYRALEASALKGGSSPKLWRVSFEPVNAVHFLAIEKAHPRREGGWTWAPFADRDLQAELDSLKEGQGA